MANPIKVDPEILGGTPCFAGTRVPIKTLFDHLEGSYSVEDFLRGFPSLERDQVVAVLELAKQRLLEPLAASPAA